MKSKRFPKTVLEIHNVRQFIAFRVFFNSRFYYPVFTILFLDFGLTLEDFAILNAVWAATIVLFEVPSGALADTLGRKNLLVMAGALMVFEIALLCFVPRDDHGVLFAVFLLNRILSGVAEAAASGADEALAYDALKAEGNTDDWGIVLEKQMRYKSIFYIGAMTLGAVVYDPAMVQKILEVLGADIRVNQDVTIRFPLYLTLVMAVMTLITTVRMREVGQDDMECPDAKACGKSIVTAFKTTLDAGRWILQTPPALIIIISGMLFDHVIRMVITLNSQYYRLIQLPEASYGLIGSGLSILGIFVPTLALKLSKRRSAGFNFCLTAALTLIGLAGIIFFLPYFGLIPVIFLYTAMIMTGFFVSHYLNRITDSRQRATVLSFKGLSFNLAYGMIGILYSRLIVYLREQGSSAMTGAGRFVSGENVVFMKSMDWFIPYFLITLALVMILSRWRLSGNSSV